MPGLINWFFSHILYLYFFYTYLKIYTYTTTED